MYALVLCLEFGGVAQILLLHFSILVDPPLAPPHLSDGFASVSIPPSGCSDGCVTFKLGQSVSFSWIFPIWINEEGDLSGGRV